MRFHPTLRFFGPLELLEVYEFYDTPVLVSCQAPSGTLYLAVAAKETSDSEDWLYVEMSRDRFNHVRSGGIDLRSAFVAPENEVTYIVSIPNDASVEASVNILATPIPEALLPAEGEFLRLETMTLEPVESEESLALKCRRNMLRLTMKLPGYARSEAPARPLGLFLSGLQETVKSIAVSIRGSVARKGAFAREILSFSELSVMAVGGSSFELLIGSSESPPLFDEVETEATEVLDYFITLLSATKDADALQGYLSEQPRVAGNLLAMLRSIEKYADSLQVKWASPYPGRTKSAKMSGVVIKAAIAAIEHRAPERRTDFWRVGRLVGASIERRVFEFKTQGLVNEQYSGKIDDEAMAEIDGAVLGNTYHAHIRRVEALKPATGELEVELTLLSLMPFETPSSSPPSAPPAPHVAG